MKNLKVGSDFSGVGAFDQALKKLGINYETIFACDMDKYARQTFIENYGEPKYYPENVYNREIPKESIDIYMTSPPCQAFSIAGKRKGETEERGVLFYNSHEFIIKNKPRYFIFENVKGLLSDDNGRTFQRWIDYLSKSVNGQPVIFPHEESANYHVYYQVLNSKDYGVPQNRERIFIIGIRDDEDNNFTFPPKEHLTKRLKDILEDDVDEKYFLSNANVNKILIGEDSDSIQCVGNLHPSGNGMNENVYDEKGISPTLSTNKGEGIKIKSARCIPVLTPDRIKKRQNGRRFKTDGEPSFTITTQDKHGIYNGFSIRRLTPRECFRLQDFPESFQMPCSDSQMYKQAGNSITVGVLEKIIKRLIKI
jgi:DNA (cytosine-5)-methyltransferase 1